MPTSFSHIDLCLFTLPLPLLQLLQNCYRYFCHCYHYYHTTLLLNTLLQILSYPGVVELTTQLLILENILWLPVGETDPPTPMGTGPLSVRRGAEAVQRADRGSTREQFYPASGRTDA